MQGSILGPQGWGSYSFQPLNILAPLNVLYLGSTLTNYQIDAR